MTVNNANRPRIAATTVRAGALGLAVGLLTALGAANAASPASVATGMAQAVPVSPLDPAKRTPGRLEVADIDFSRGEGGSGKLTLRFDGAGAMADLLGAGVDPAAPENSLETLGEGVEHLSRAAQDLLASEARMQSARLTGEFTDVGAPDELAARVAHLFEMDGAVGLAKLARQTEIAVTDLTGAFTALGAELGLDWAQSAANRFEAHDQWERLLTAGLARDFEQLRLEFLERRRNGDPREAVDKWVDAQGARIAHVVRRGDSLA